MGQTDGRMDNTKNIVSLIHGWWKKFAQPRYMLYKHGCSFIPRKENRSSWLPKTLNLQKFLAYFPV